MQACVCANCHEISFLSGLTMQQLLLLQQAGSEAAGTLPRLQAQGTSSAQKSSEMICMGTHAAQESI